MLPAVKGAVAESANDRQVSVALACLMSRSASSWEPPAIRLHRINEWAEARNMKQADIVRETGIDKATVSRWFRGAIPREEHLKILCELLHLEDPSDLFMHPENDWLARLLKGRSEEEIVRIKVMIEAAFPKKVA